MKRKKEAKEHKKKEKEAVEGPPKLEKPDLSKMSMAEQLQWNIEEMKRKNVAKKAKKEAAK